MNKNQYLEIANYGNGRYVRVRYKTDMDKKLSAASRKRGVHAFKVTEQTVRVGSNYNHMKSVIDRKATEDVNEVKDVYEWVIPNKIKRHKENGTEYLVCGTMPHPNSKVTFVIYDSADNVNVTNKLTDTQKELFIPSAFPTHDKPMPEVFSIKLENVEMFNYVF